MSSITYTLMLFQTRKTLGRLWRAQMKNFLIKSERFVSLINWVFNA